MARYSNNEFVKWTYRIETRDHDDPSPDELRHFDEEMFGAVERHLRDQMARFDIEWTPRNRSLIAMLTFSSPGTGRRRVERACRFWAHVKGISIPREDLQEWPVDGS